MKKCLTTLYCLTVLLSTAAISAHELTIRADALDRSAELPAPEFVGPINTHCGWVTLSFGVSNPTVGASTEIYRSLTKDGVFQYRYTLAPGANSFVDDALQPRTSYYYTLRSMMDGDASGFSDTLELTSGSQFFNPILDTDYTEDGSFKFTLHDHSYADASYEIFKSESSSEQEDVLLFFTEFSIPDSGSTFIFYDTTEINDSGEYHYIVNAILGCEGRPVLYSVAGDTIWKFPREELVAPRISIYHPPANDICGNEVDLMIENFVGEGHVELYRSFSPDAGFELIYIQLSDNDYFYYDKDLLPNTHYYYKARVLRDGEFSEFSEVLTAVTGPALYPPAVTTTVLPDQTVRVDIQDRSYLDYSYLYYGLDRIDGITTVLGQFQLLDSGRTYTFTDTLVVPGGIYSYIVISYNNCDGFPQGTQYVSDSITIESRPVAPALYNFSLVDPFSDLNVRVLAGRSEFNAASKYNIVANANEKTGSVAFLLNGKKYKDNTSPFALFGEHRGNFHPGKLKAGSYTLTATPYSNKNFKGVKGTSLTVQFEVKNQSSSSVLAMGQIEKMEIRVYPNPLTDHATLEVAGKPGSKVQVEIIDQSGNMFLRSADYLNEAGVLSKEWDTHYLKKGTYYMLIRMGSQTVTRHIIVDP
jgi:hypothetical protein